MADVEVRSREGSTAASRDGDNADKTYGGKPLSRATSLLRAPTFLRGKTEIFAETAELERAVTFLKKGSGQERKRSQQQQPQSKGDGESDGSDYDTDLEDVESGCIFGAIIQLHCSGPNMQLSSPFY